MGARRGVRDKATLDKNRRIVSRVQELRQQGVTRPNAQVAREFGVTRERVRQIVADPDRLKLAED